MTTSYEAVMSRSAPRAKQPIPVAAGIGLRPPHFSQVIETLPATAWFEVHSENFFAESGEMRRLLREVREHYPVSLHGVGLSLGSADRLRRNHLLQLKRLCDEIEPGLVSEHISWGAIDHHHLSALLPLPYTEESLALMTARIDEAQELLGRPLLLENASTYLAYRHSTIPEWEFVRELARRSGCLLLLDVNNIFVNSVNHGFDPYRFVDAIPPEQVAEFHLAGFSRKSVEGEQGEEIPLLIDSHDHPVYNEVWDLYHHTLRTIGPRPTLIEWDANIPKYRVLQSEAEQAQQIIDGETANRTRAPHLNLATETPIPAHALSA